MEFKHKRSHLDTNITLGLTNDKHSSLLQTLKIFKNLTLSPCVNIIKISNKLECLSMVRFSSLIYCLRVRPEAYTSVESLG